MAESSEETTRKTSDRLEQVTLDDDRSSAEQGFQGATLQISSGDGDGVNGGAASSENAEEPNVSPGAVPPQTAPPATQQSKTSVVSAHEPIDASGPATINTIGGGSEDTASGFSRNRPGSVIGRTSVRSTSSRTSVRSEVLQPVTARSYYCYKESHFEKAVSNVKHIILPELDGELKSSWLLCEIDHWDFEREKIILLTEYSIFVVKYNFINEKLYEYRRIMLHILNSILIGDFLYPDMSLMPNRQHGGIQIRWDRGEGISFGQKWNPWCTDIPWLTLSHHPLIYNPKENETATYNVDEFFETLVAATSKVFTEKRPGETLKVIEGPITIESYASPASVVFNQSKIGFFRDRNGVSF